MKVAVLGVLAALALPAVAQAKPPLSLARGRLAITRYEGPSGTVEGCRRLSRTAVRCTVTEADPSNPGWLFSIREVAYLHVRSRWISVSAPGWLDTRPYGEPY